MQLSTATPQTHHCGESTQAPQTHAHATNTSPTTIRSLQDYERTIQGASDSIRISRVLCILCMTYVHTHLLSQHAFESTWYFSSTRAVLVDLFGRSSVPLLSMISGALLVGVVRRRSLLQVMQGRARGLLLPMVMWNLIGLALAVMTAKNLPGDVVNAVFALTGQAQYAHLTFLRDVFVVSLGTPLFVRLAERTPLMFLTGIISLTVWFDLKPIVLRDQILLYYVVGVYIGVYRSQALAHRFVRTFTHIAMACLLMSAVMSQYVPQLSRIYYHGLFEDLLRRPICALWFWLIARGLAQNEAVLKLVRQHLEPAIFLMFLSHATVNHVLGSVYARWVPPHGVTYFVVWLLMPPACLLLAVVGNKLVVRLPATVGLLLTGQAPTPRPARSAGLQVPQATSSTKPPHQRKQHAPFTATIAQASSLADSAMGSTAARVRALSSPRTAPPSRR